MKDMKISFLLPNLEGGGAERIMLSLSEEFARRGLETDLVLMKKEGVFLKDVGGDVNIAELNCRRGVFSVVPVKKYLESKHPDVLITTLDHVNVAAIAAKTASRAGCALIINQGIHFSSSKRAQNKILILLLRCLYPRAKAINLIIAVSGGVRDDLVSTLRVPEDKIRVIYNPIDVENIFRRKDEPVPQFDFLCREGGYRIILGAGRLTRQKGFDFLIKTFCRLREKRKAKLIILGEGEQRAELEKLAEESGVKNDVYLPGFVENPWSYMSRADVFVLASRWEGFGNVIVEALACGTTVVSADCPSGPAEILENGKYGKLVPAGDADAFAAAVEESLDAPFDPEFLRARAMDFRVSRIADEYLRHISGFFDKT